MTMMKVLCLAAMLAAGAVAHAAPAAAPAPIGAPAASHVKPVQDMLAAMQAEKLMRSIAGASRYGSEEQRKAVFAKLDKVPAAEVYARLAGPVARLVSAETAQEMTRYYASSYGQKVLRATYNSGPSYGDNTPVPTAAERKELKKPELVKAQKAFAQAEDGIRHEAFLLLQAVSKR
jgi:hypothetical protein